MMFLTFNRLRDPAACLLGPQTCVVCGEPSIRSVPICHNCESDRLGSVVLNDERCSRCGRPLVSALDLCTDCRLIAPLKALDRVYPLYPYDSTAQELLAAWKLSDNFAMTVVFAGVIARALAAFPGISIVPVPPRPGKIRKKGWDQIELLVRHLEQLYSIPVIRCLLRTSTIQQKGLGKEARFMNIKGHIVHDGKTPLPDTVMLIDDLMTTGATLEACASVLKEINCSRVTAMTLFYD